MSSSTTPTIGLRERNKERRRVDILTAAYQLFAEKGYHATTIADIAAAADIAPRTVSLYFPTKQDIVLDGVMSLIAPISDAIERLKPGESALDAIMTSLGAHLKERQLTDPHGMTARLKADPEIHGIITSCFEDLQHKGALALARDLGAETIDRRVEVTLAALRGVVEFAMFASSPEEIDEILDLGCDFLKAGFRNLANAPGNPAN